MGKESGDVFIGWAIGLSNQELELDFAGSPREVLDSLKGKGLRFADVAQHLQTQIRQTEVFAAESAGDAGRLGMTPLHWAAASGRRDEVERLLAAGAEVELNWFMMSADQLAFRNNHLKLAAWMEAQIPDTYKEWGFDDIIEFLVFGQ